MSDDASRTATQDVFRWASLEGRRVEERDLWGHDWLRELDDEEDESAASND